jgi:hypothetical protein
MTFFKIVLGFECGVDKTVCALGYPDYCAKCISKKFKNAHLITEIGDVAEQDSVEKRQEMNYRYIWRKYQDILNIRHIIILSKGGLSLFNLPVGDDPINATLLSGFIQANVIFSDEGLTERDKKAELDWMIKERFYEFQYKHFNILLRDGNFSRVCLILDESASENLREFLSNFTEIFEEFYKKDLIEFDKTCSIDPYRSSKDLIEKTFEIYMIYPQTLSAQIPPNVIQNFPLIQRALYEYSKDLMKDNPYFFIPNLLTKTYRTLGVKSKEEIIWNIYQMLREKIILAKEMKFHREEIVLREQEIQEREYEIKTIIEMKDAEDIREESLKLSINEARKKMKLYFKKAEIAEKDAAYEIALTEYKRALQYAREFNLEPDIGKISYKILQVLKSNKLVEIKFASEQANKAEKKKDYITALKYLFQIRNILIGEYSDEEYNKKLIKLDQRIDRLQNNLR